MTAQLSLEWLLQNWFPPGRCCRPEISGRCPLLHHSHFVWGRYSAEERSKNHSSLLRTCLDPSQSNCHQRLLPEKWKFSIIYTASNPQNYSTGCCPCPFSSSTSHPWPHSIPSLQRVPWGFLQKAQPKPEVRVHSELQGWGPLLWAVIWRFLLPNTSDRKTIPISCLEIIIHLIIQITCFEHLLRWAPCCSRITDVIIYWFMW